MVVESALSRHCPLWPVVRFVTLSDASRHDRVGLRSLWRPPLSLPRAHTFGAITSSCLFADAVCFDHSSPVLIRSQSLVLSTAGGSSRPWPIGESWQRLGFRLRPDAATGRSQRFSPDLAVPSSRNKIAASHGPPLALRSQAMQRSGSLPAGSPTRPRWARPCNLKGHSYVDYR